LEPLKEVAGAIRVLADAQRRTKAELAVMNKTLISIDKSLKRMRPDRPIGEVISSELANVNADPNEDDRR
jgi:hypothetical protein